MWQINLECSSGNKRGGAGDCLQLAVQKRVSHSGTGSIRGSECMNLDRITQASLANL